MSRRGGASARPPQRVCFFGTYRRDYTVTRLLLQGCRAAGLDVVECHRPLWEEKRDKHSGYFRGRSAAWLLLRYAGAALALTRERRRLGAVSLYLLGFNGQFDILLLRLLCREKTPTVLAPLVTLTETLVDDRAVYRPGSLGARAVHWVDHASLTLASQVIMDAEAHCQYVVASFGVPADRVATWYLGADTAVFQRRPQPAANDPLRVLFYGSYLPLHGVSTILEAARELRDRHAIEFVLVGDGPERQASEAYARRHGLAGVRFVDWVPYETLGRLIGDSHICLGVFGTSSKVRMVIPNKVYQAAAVGRAVVTADSPAVREVFTHGDTAWLCPPGDAPALAQAIRDLADAADVRNRLGQRAAALMAERFSPCAQGQRLADILARAEVRA